MRPIHTLAVFCGSSTGSSPAYVAAAEELGEAMAKQGVKLVYGGGDLGCMGALAAAVLRHNGEVIGVIPAPLNRYVEEQKKDSADAAPAPAGMTTIVTETMHERKQRMYDMSDAFVALPGGYGTWEELLEATTHQQLGIHAKPVALLNVQGFYDPLLAMVARAAQDGFVRERDVQRIKVFATVEEVLPGLARLERVPSMLSWSTKAL